MSYLWNRTLLYSETRKRILNEIEEHHRAVEELTQELLNCELKERYNYEVGSIYPLTERFHEAFPTIKATVAQIMGLTRDGMILVSLNPDKDPIPFSIDTIRLILEK